MKAILTDYRSQSPLPTTKSRLDLSREELKVTQADRRVTFRSDFLTTSPDLATVRPDEALAIGVLGQAAHDLRRFHTAINGMERELYLDAYSWILATDFSWPYSFVNVCKLLDACPD